MTTNAVKFQFSVTRLRCFGKTDLLRRGVTGTFDQSILTRHSWWCTSHRKATRMQST